MEFTVDFADTSPWRLAPGAEQRLDVGKDGGSQPWPAAHTHKAYFRVSEFLGLLE